MSLRGRPRRQPPVGHRLNRASYNAIAAQWDDARRSFYGREQAYLARFLDGLPSGSTIVEAGCGTGRPMAEYAIARRYRLIGIDQSEAWLAKARERFPAQQWIHAALEDHPFGERGAGVILWDTLFHIPRERHAMILRRIAACLCPGGRLMLTSGGSEHPSFTDSMFGREFFYDSFAPPTVLAMLHEVNFVVLIGEYMNLPTGGRDKGRYAIVARKEGG